MTHVAELEDVRASDPVERLLEDSWDSRLRTAGSRELIAEAGAATLFLAVAVPLAAPALGSVRLGVALLLVALYAITARAVRFPIGAGHIVPTYLVLVPMLLLLPARTVPLLAAAGLVLGTGGRLVARGAKPQELVFSVADAWHTLGPAMVLWLAGPAHGLELARVYLAAFFAGGVVDLLASSAREALTRGIAPRLQVRVIAVVWLVDACVASLGLLVAHAAQHDPAQLLLLLPVNGLLIAVNRDRSARIAQAQHRLGLVARERTRLQEAIHNLEALREQALSDALTRLGNRRKLAEDLAEMLPNASAQAPLVMMLFDLDGFKSYNDTFGHVAGDALLARLGHKLRAAVSPHGTAYRLGGDEFCVLLPARPEALHESIAAAAAALEEHGETFAISASCGAVLLPHEATTADYALQLADERMYTHKHGRASGAREQAHDVLIHIMQAQQPGLPDYLSGVGQLAISIGRRLGMDAEQLDELTRAAALHDVGEVGIPDAILTKAGPLDSQEWNFVRQHTVLGERILSAAPALRPVATIVRATHERWDGAGYPDGLRGDGIPLAARIIAVCEAYDAIITDRCYRPARAPELAREELRHEAGRQFDPAVVAEFLAELERRDTRTSSRDAAARTRRAHFAAEVASRIYDLLEQAA